ncbi:MAG: transcription termination/antitermination protein NusG [Bacteroidetes bacterium]|nr:transcription termination/antitermination protein NusG [Bacteroidota bacterium]MCY4233080.1 transcription termination/antitermination protein NusG [Bacteroidota bacterium]
MTRTTAPKFEWYALQAFSGSEKKVKEYIIETIENEGLSDQLEEILIPSQNVFVMRGGKKSTREKTDFPGYMLIRAKLDKRLMHVFKEQIFKQKKEAIKWIPTRDKPDKVRVEDIDRILGRMDKAREAGHRPEIPFSTGDAIRVIDGPFNTFSGVVDDVYPDKMKVRVMVSILGRKTPVEMDYLQIVKED